MTTHIIGGAGFIGTAIIDGFRVAGRSDVTVLDRRHRLMRSEPLLRDIRTIQIDSGFGDAITKLFQPQDTLIHLGWTAQPASSMANLTDDISANIIASVDLFSKAIDAGINTIIFASSGGTVYGNTAVTQIAESQPLTPVSAYGAAKISVEAYLQVLAATRGIDGISFRIGNPYGLYQLNGTPIGLFANFIRCAMENRQATVFGNGDKVRDYLAIEDVARAFLLAIDQSIPSGAYNIGSGRGVSIKQVIDILNHRLPQPLKVKYSAERSFDAKRVVLDSTKFKSATGWRAEQTLEAGIQGMIDHASTTGACDVSD